MKREERIKTKIDEAIDILKKFEMPKAQQNERTAYCLLALLDVTPEKEWRDAESPLVGITPMMSFAKEHYGKEYAPNTRETFRRFSTHQMLQAGIALYNPDNPGRPVNSPNAAYQISPDALEIIKAYKTDRFENLLKNFINKRPTLSKKYAHEREMKMVSIQSKVEPFDSNFTRKTQRTYPRHYRTDGAEIFARKRIDLCRRHGRKVGLL